MIKILQKEERALREIAKPVPVREITSPRIKKIIADMKKAMRKESDAVAIAAPQIGVPLRIFIVSGKVLSLKQIKKNLKLQDENRELTSDLVCINPELLKCSQKKSFVQEGCLSVRWLYGEVERSEKATIRAYDERGKLFTRGGSSILAQVFQHEIEHLEGKLFIDKAKNIQEILPEKQKQ